MEKRRRFNAMQTIETGREYAILSLSTAIYKVKDVKICAAEMLDECLVMLDGDSTEILVELQGKEPEKLVDNFCRKLLKCTS